MRLVFAVAVSAAMLATTGHAAGLSASHYVQDGLVALFDAEDNEGTGTHNSSASQWKDLKGSAYVNCVADSIWSSRYFCSPTNQNYIKDMPTLDRNSITVEAAFDMISHATKNYACIVHGGEYFKFFYNDPDATGVVGYMCPVGGISNVDGSGYKWVKTASGFSSGTVSFFSGSDGYGVRADGMATGSPSDYHVAIANYTLSANAWSLNQNEFAGNYYCVRWYDRALSDDEMLANAFIDKLRFRSYMLAGDGSEADWSAVAWEAPYDATASAPSTDTNEFVRIANAEVNVAASDNVGLAGLSLEDGAVLDIADGAVVSVKVLYVEGVEIERGIYSGDETKGRKVSWLNGSGVLKVAGGKDVDDFPETYLLPGEDGWFQFGTQSGSYGSVDTYAGAKREYFIGEHVDWRKCSFPAGGNNKLRLAGYSLIGAIPSGTFSVVDLSKATIVQLYEPQMFEDGTQATVPYGVILRYHPGTWEKDESTGRYYRMGSSSDPYAGDIYLNGAAAVLRVSVDNGLKEVQFSGLFSGTGKLQFSAWGNRARFSGGFALNNYIGSFQHGSLVWLDTTMVTSRLEGVTFAGCNDSYVNDQASGYRVNGLYFGKNGSEETADHELYLKYVNGTAKVGISTTTGIRLRSGAVLGIWGGNTVHAGYMTANGSVHVIARPQELKSTFNGWHFKAVGAGDGNFVVDEVRVSSKLYMSEHVNMTAGNVLANACFDYTFATNETTVSFLDITNACDSTATVVANDIASLPARLSGFTGTVSLSSAATKSYTMPVDMTQGTDILYNTVGCIGSGALAGAPAAGAIDATFPTDSEPVKGDYSLARFTSGGEALAGWTVTLNGQALTDVQVGGMMVSVVKDSTGIWLKVRETGMTFLLR